jgi:hypothetical protein
MTVIVGTEHANSPDGKWIGMPWRHAMIDAQEKQPDSITCSAMTSVSGSSAMKNNVYRVVVESHVNVKARSEAAAKTLAEIAVRQAVDSHTFLYATSPLVFNDALGRNSFLAKKATPEEI